MASHTDEQIERIIEAFHTVGLATGLIEEPAATSA